MRVVAADWASLQGFCDGDEGIGLASEGEERIAADLALLLVSPSDRPLQGFAGYIDWRSGGALTALISNKSFLGHHNEKLLRPADANLPFLRMVLYGVGEVESWEKDGARRLAQDIVECARGLRARSVALAWVEDPGRSSRWKDCLDELVRILTSAPRELKGLKLSACEATGPDSSVDGLSVELIDAEGPEGSKGAVEAPDVESRDPQEAEPADEELSLTGDESEDGQGVDSDSQQRPTSEDAREGGSPFHDVGPRGKGEAEPDGAHGERWWIVAPEALCTRLRGRILGTPRATEAG